MEGEGKRVGVTRESTINQNERKAEGITIAVGPCRKPKGGGKERIIDRLRKKRNRESDEEPRKPGGVGNKDPAERVGEGI